HSSCKTLLTIYFFKRNMFSMFYFISILFHKIKKIIPVFSFLNCSIYIKLKPTLPRGAFLSRLIFLITFTLSFIFFLIFLIVFIYDNKIIFLAELITLIPNYMVTSFIRLIAFSSFPINIIKNNMIVNMVAIHMG